jgi:hypothetical protein
MKHLYWTQTRYRELLPGHITFAIAKKQPLVYRAEESLEFYRDQPEGGAPRFVDELLKHLKYTRYNAPYILLVMLMNPVDDFPGGGGRPINGGFNTGGGIVIFSSSGLDKAPNVQSTFQHELGHSFGLPHVDSYGMDMMTNPSFMSYNPNHHTNGFIPSKTPGILNPEDLRALALNQRVFHGLRFEPKRDIPKGYSICPVIVGLGPMILPEGMDNVKVTTDSGEADGSTVGSVLVGDMKPGDLSFDPSVMWRSLPSSTGWVSLDVEFPVEAALTRVRIHSMPLGTAEAIQSVKVSWFATSGELRSVGSTKVKATDQTVQFAKNSAKKWRIGFQVQPGGSAVIRGLEFYDGKEQLFPPLVPYQP